MDANMKYGSKKLISVALCTCNGEKYIYEQLHSIVNQTLMPNEIIVCDDASDDGTLEIINFFVQKYPMIRWVVKQNISRKGVRLNFEQAIMNASCDFIATSDQDDIWEKNKLEVLLDLIQKEGVALVHTDFQLIDAEGNPLEAKNGVPLELSLKSYIFENNNVTGCTCFFRAGLKDKLSPFPRNFYYHDRWIAIVAFNNGGIYFCNQPLIRYRQHDANVVATLGGGGKSKKDTVKSIQKKADDLLLLIKKRKEIKYSWSVYLLLLKQFCTCKTGLAYLKMKLLQNI